MCVRLLAYEWVWDSKQGKHRRAVALSSNTGCVLWVIKRMLIKSDYYCGRKDWYSTEIRVSKSKSESVTQPLFIVSPAEQFTQAFTVVEEVGPKLQSRIHVKKKSHPSFVSPVPSSFPTQVALSHALPRLADTTSLSPEGDCDWLIDSLSLLV